MTDLLPCPFCGRIPDCTVARTWSRGWNVFCTNPDCAVRPTVYREEPTNAIKAWNTRTESTTIAALERELAEVKAKYSHCTDKCGGEIIKNAKLSLSNKALAEALTLAYDQLATQGDPQDTNNVYTLWERRFLISIKAALKANGDVK